MSALVLDESKLEVVTSGKIELTLGLSRVGSRELDEVGLTRVKVDLETVHESWVGVSKVEDSLKVSESRRGRIEVIESVPRILASERKKERGEGVSRIIRSRLEERAMQRRTRRATFQTRSCGTELNRACSIRASPKQASRS